MTLPLPANHKQLSQ